MGKNETIFWSFEFVEAMELVLGKKDEDDGAREGGCTGRLCICVAWLGAFVVYCCGGELAQHTEAFSSKM